MENASKALLIAAGTLLGMLIIFVAIRMFSSASGVAKSYHSQESASDIAAFNSNFTKFVGATRGEENEEVQFATIHDVISTANFAWNYNRKRALRLDINPILEPDGHELIHVELCELDFDSNKPGNKVYRNNNHFENFTDEIYQNFIKNGYYVLNNNPDQDNIITYEIEIVDYDQVGKIKTVKFYPSKYNDKNNHNKSTINTINNNLKQVTSGMSDEDMNKIWKK